MALARGKIIKVRNEEPDEIEKQISQALLDLEVNSDLKASLRELHITAAKEVECAAGKKAIVIFVPVPQLKAFQKIQPCLNLLECFQLRNWQESNRDLRASSSAESIPEDSDKAGP